MREVKFRYTVKFAQGNIEHKFYSFQTIQNRSIKDLFPVELSGWCELLGCAQSTGFTDKNGKEIYEGDILSDWTDTDEGKVQSKVQVYWEPNEGAWYLDYSMKQDQSNGDLLSEMLRLFDYEVTGNIFE